MHELTLKMWQEWECRNSKIWKPTHQTDVLLLFLQGLFIFMLNFFLPRPLYEHFCVGIRGSWPSVYFNPKHDLWLVRSQIQLTGGGGGEELTSTSRQGLTGGGRVEEGRRESSKMVATFYQFVMKYEALSATRLLGNPWWWWLTFRTFTWEMSVWIPHEAFVCFR